jgi:adenylyltransferase/sulfurtransferase
MDEQLERYHRQVLLQGIGETGQRALGGSTALLLGCGALGSVAADLLARAGVGHLVIVDRDFVELTNLQRQVLFDESDVAAGLPTAEAARRRLARVNSGVTISAIVDDINADSISELAKGADILVDGLDNFETRYIANDYAVKHGVPYVYGAAVGTTGMALPILPHTRDGRAPWESEGGSSFATPCLRCLFEEPPPPGTSPTCDTIGVLNAAVSIVASFEVAEALKILTGNYAQVSRTLLNFDLWQNEFHRLGVDKARDKSDCPACRRYTFEFLEGGAGSTADTLCGRNAIQLRHRQTHEPMNFEELAARLEVYGEVRISEFLLRANITDGDKRYELSLFPDGRAIVKGTDSPAEARAAYARYVGA